MDLDIADFAVDYARKLGASYSEARLEKVSSNGFLLKNGVAEISGFERSVGLGMRFVVNGALGFCSTNVLEKENIKQEINNSLKRQQSASRLIDNEVKFSDEEVHKDKFEVKSKINCSDISPEEKIGYLEDIEKRANDKGTVSTYFSLNDSVTEKYFISSEGSKIYSKIPTINFFYYLTLKKDGETSQRYWQHGNTMGWEATKEWNLEKNVPKAVKTMGKTMKEGLKPPKGKIDLVVGPEISGIIAHESGGHPYEADRILGREAAQAGESFITPSMINSKISNPIVNVVDDPSILKSYGFLLYDDEGVKAKKKYLIKEGKINEFLLNRETAFDFKTKSNGASRANSFDREPIVRMSNTFIEPGELSEEELFEGIGSGIYMKNFTEWNIDDKRVHQKYVGSESYLIENGRIKGLVKKPVLEISTQSLYSKIDAVADNLELHAATCGKGEPMQGIRVSIGGPSIRINNVKLSN